MTCGANGVHQIVDGWHAQKGYITQESNAPPYLSIYCILWATKRHQRHFIRNPVFAVHGLCAAAQLANRIRIAPQFQEGCRTPYKCRMAGRGRLRNIQLTEGYGQEEQ